MLEYNGDDLSLKTLVCEYNQAITVAISRIEDSTETVLRSTAIVTMKTLHQAFRLILSIYSKRTDWLPQALQNIYNEIYAIQNLLYEAKEKYNDILNFSDKANLGTLIALVEKEVFAVKDTLDAAMEPVNEDQTIPQPDPDTAPKIPEPKEQKCPWCPCTIL